MRRGRLRNVVLSLRERVREPRGAIRTRPGRDPTEQATSRKLLTPNPLLARFPNALFAADMTREPPTVAPKAIPNWLHPVTGRATIHMQ